LLDDITRNHEELPLRVVRVQKKDAQSGTEIPSFVVDLVPDDGETVVQPWSIGFASDWDISEDGMTVLPPMARRRSSATRTSVADEESDRGRVRRERDGGERQACSRD